MAPRSTDWQLLFGLIALQTGLIDSSQLVTAFTAWSDDREKQQRLDERLVNTGMLSRPMGEALARMVDLHIEQHGGDLQRSLATLQGSDLDDVRPQLEQIDNAELNKSMATMPGLLSAADSTEYAEPDDSVGQVSSEGTRFRILRPLDGGQGGMGVISVAHDNELDRIVALKQILPGRADQPKFRQKFQVEAEITGNLEHPGIVPIYGLGTGPDGRPYYAMRLVHGDNLGNQIDEFHARSVDYTSVSFHGLIDRLIDVAQAIRYAHSRGVLHRDLKPGNILVGEFGETLVIDWGLARVSQADDLPTDDTLPVVDGRSSLHVRSGSNVAATMPGQILGTVGYAPPEQLSGHIDQISERSDVYALGAILYQILMGRPPLKKDSQLKELIRDATEGRITAPHEQRRSIPKALSAVCMQALQTDPANRYESVDEFVSELECWKADQPVQAAPDSVADRALRFARRHRAATLAAAVSLFAISLVTVVALLFVNRARLNESVAKQNAQLFAEEKSQLAERNQAVVDSFVAAFRSANPTQPGTTSSMTALQVLEKGLARMEKDDGLAGDPLAKASLLEAIGTSLVALGAQDRAIPALEESLQLRSQELGDVHDHTLTSRAELGTAYRAAGRLEEALQMHQEVVLRRRQSLGDDHPHTMRSITNLATIYNGLGRLDEALPLYEESLRRNRENHGDEHFDTLLAMNNLATGYYAAGRNDEAIALNEETLKAITRMMGEQHPYTLLSINNLAYGYQNIGRLDEAIAMYEQALQGQLKRVGRKHADAIQSMSNLTTAYRTAGRLEEATTLAQEALELSSGELGEQHPQTMILLSNLAATYSDAEEFDKSMPLFEEALRRKKAKWGNEHPSTLRSMANLASEYFTLGEVERALPIYEQALRLRKAKLGVQHPDTLNSMEHLANALVRNGQFDRAGEVTAAWVGHVDQQRMRARFARAQLVNAAVLIELRQAEQAMKAVKVAIDSQELDDLAALRAQFVLAAAHAVSGEEGAVDKMTQAYRQLRKRLPDIRLADRWWIVRECEQIVVVYQKADDAAALEQWETELEKLKTEIDSLLKTS